MKNKIISVIFSALMFVSCIGINTNFVFADGYSVSYPQNMAHGVMTISPIPDGSQNVGDEMTITFSNEDGWEVSNLSVKNVSTQENVEITKNSETVYKFLFPEGNVEISCELTNSNIKSTNIKYDVDEKYEWSVPTKITFTKDNFNEIDATGNDGQVKVDKCVIYPTKQLFIEVANDQEFTIADQTGHKLNYAVYADASELVAGETVIKYNSGENVSNAQAKITATLTKDTVERAGDYQGTLQFVAELIEIPDVKTEEGTTATNVRFSAIPTDLQESLKDELKLEGTDLSDEDIENSVVLDIDADTPGDVVLNVSSYAEVGETVLIYHKSSVNGWELVGRGVVDETGLITCSFNDFSPIFISILSGTIVSFDAGEHGHYDVQPESVLLTDGMVIELEDPKYIPIADEGYTFKTYTYDSENKKFIAQYELNKYTYTFYDEDGTTSLKSETVDYGTVISAPSNPSKSATAQYTYTFDGWYTAKEGGEKVTSFANITSDVNYFARYTSTVNKYTVSFNANGHGTAPQAQSIEYGSKVTKPEDLTEEGWEFDGWYTEATCENEYDFFTAIFSTKTIYAKWEKILAPGLYVDGVMYKALTLDDCGTDASKVSALVTKENTNIVLPDGITSLCEQAFTKVTWSEPTQYLPSWPTYNANKNVKSITIPNTVKNIGNNAFAACVNLESVKYKTNSQLTSIGDYAFYATALKTINIPDGVETIGNAAFYASSFNLVNIPNSVTTIGQSAFGQISLNTISITIPDSVSTIGNTAFTNIKQIYYSGTATGSPWGAVNLNSFKEGNFEYLNSTKTELLGYNGNGETVSIPNSVTTICSYAFANTSDTLSITIPNSVKVIEKNAFINCKDVKSILFEEGSQLTSIGEGAFNNCTSLTSITIPSSVNSIGGYAFSNCEKLTSFIFENNSQITSINNRTFCNCLSLSSFIIPNGVITIGDSAFRNCINLSEVTIPDSVIEIQAGAFAESGLTSLTIPKHVNNIHATAFGACAKLSTINVDSNNNMYYSNNLNGIFKKDATKTTLVVGCKNTIIPNDVTNIGMFAFYGRSDLTSITIPSSILVIESGAFGNCTRLKELAIPNSVVAIYSDALTNVPHIYYSGTAIGSPWGALAIN